MCDCLPFDVEWKRKKSINQMHAHTPRNTFDNKSKNQQHPQWKRIVKSGRRYASREYIPLCFKLNFTMLHVTLTLYAQQEFVVIHLDKNTPECFSNKMHSMTVATIPHKYSYITYYTCGKRDLCATVLYFSFLLFWFWYFSCVVSFRFFLFSRLNVPFGVLPFNFVFNAVRCTIWFFV